MELPPLTVPAFPDVNLSFVINTPVLIVILAIYVVLYGITSSVLIYHWAAYGMRSSGVLVAETLFFFVSLILLTMAGLAISYF